MRRHGPRSSPSLPSPGLSIRVVGHFQELEALAAEWNGLLSQSATNSLFQTWRYTATWWKHFGARRRLCVLLAEENGELVGIAPLMISSGQSGIRRQIAHLAFISTLGEAHGLYNDFIIRQGMEERVTKAFFGPGSPVYREPWDLLYLSLMPAEAASTTVMRRQLAGMGHFVEKELEPAPVIDFAPTWDQFLESKSPHFRRRIRKTMRDAETKLGGGVVRAGVDLPVEEMYRPMMEFNRTRWEQENAGLRTDDFFQFERDLLDAHAASGDLHFYGWRTDGKLAALNCAFHHAGSLWGYQLAWDPAFAKFSPGAISMALVVQRGIEEKFSGLNMLHGASAYKDSWAGRCVELIRLEAPHPRSLRGRLFEMVVAIKEHAGKSSGARPPAPPAEPE